MSVSLGAVCNVYNEIHALPGWLECVTQWADDIQVMHAGPGGADSTDGTIELLEKWRVPIHRCKIDDGFGVVRTAAVRASKCDWVMVLDADERFHPCLPVLTCSGVDTASEDADGIIRGYDAASRDCRGTGDGQWYSWERVGELGAGLAVKFGEVYNQAAWLKDFLQHGALDAVVTIRRHWHDLTLRRPTQNWHVRPDDQTRVVRNAPSIHFDSGTRMHERLVGGPNRYQPNHTHGPFFEHFHFWFKAMAPLQRAHNVAVYDALHYGTEVPRQ